jgi:hypothetical protein
VIGDEAAVDLVPDIIAIHGVAVCLGNHLDRRTSFAKLAEGRETKTWSRSDAEQ